MEETQAASARKTAAVTKEGMGATTRHSGGAKPRAPGKEGERAVRDEGVDCGTPPGTRSVEKGGIPFFQPMNIFK